MLETKKVIEKAINTITQMIIHAEFDAVIDAGIDALVNGYAVKHRLSVLLALKGIEANPRAPERARQLAAEGFTLLTHSAELPDLAKKTPYEASPAS